MKQLRLYLVAAALAGGTPAAAGCLIDVPGAKCVQPATRGLTPAPQAPSAKWLRTEPRPPLFAVGDVLPAGRYNVLLNTAYYGLPPVGPDWLYYRVEDDVYRVDRRSMEILEWVTLQAARTF